MKKLKWAALLTVVAALALTTRSRAQAPPAAATRAQVAQPPEQVPGMVEVKPARAGELAAGLIELRQRVEHLEQAQAKQQDWFKLLAKDIQALKQPATAAAGPPKRK
jgi:hypothetical protein